MVIKIRKDSALKQQLRRLEIALVIDNTSSMSREISQVKKRMGELLDRIVAHELKIQSRFAVIGYRDHPPQDRSFIARTFCGLETDSSVVYGALKQMKAVGGGDGPEAVVDGLQQALTLRWEKASQKAIILVGDAPPHGEGGADDGFPSGCPCNLNIDSIATHMETIPITGHAVGVRADSVMTRVFSRFATTAGGIFVSLGQVTDLIPLLLRRIDEEMGKIAADLRTVEKLERGDTISAADAESLRRLEKKGVRAVEMTPSALSDREAVKKPRIRVLK